MNQHFVSKGGALRMAPRYYLAEATVQRGDDVVVARAGLGASGLSRRQRWRGVQTKADEQGQDVKSL